jgi:thioredoxin reductase/NAD-dependent dihydropyrimidine dehydrogenase PreA subunit
MSGRPNVRRERAAGSSDDVNRSRGLFSGAVLGAVVLLAGLFALHGPAALVSPGPLALPHRELGCADCHRGSVASNGCTGCHGTHASRRAAHQALSLDGKLGCGDCHAVHRAELGIRFEPGGEALVFGTGFEASVPSPLAGRREARVTVPLVEAGVCAQCHDLGSPSVPAAPCAPRKGAEALSVCFDEHRAPAGATVTARAERDAAVEAARAIVASGPERPFSSSLSAQALLLGGALASGLGVAFLKRRRPRFRSAAPSGAVPDSGARRLPVIDAARCLGCHACVDACPYDVLEVRRYVAVVARPDACCGAGPCEARCPNGSLTLAVAGPAVELPFGRDLEVRDRTGVFVAGDIAGGSLIRDALRHGVLVAHAVKRRTELSQRRANVADLVVIGAGPAGLAAALAARELDLEVVVLEQAALAESIRRFSRQKLVLDAPEDPDERLPLFIGDVHKEELVERWSYEVRRARVDVREGMRAIDLEVPDSDGIRRVVVEDRSGVRLAVPGRAVLVAIGRRGAPRTLDVPIDPAVLPRVHYELSDARAFAGRRVVVVGLGDVAMETALALAAQPGARVTLVHRGDGFRRGKKRNIDALSGLVARGRVELILAARPTRISATGLEIDGRDGPRVLGFDAVFVALGSLPSTELLSAAGVCVRS